MEQAGPGHRGSAAGDAGTYTCQDEEGFGEKKSAELVVVGEYSIVSMVSRYNYNIIVI